VIPLQAAVMVLVALAGLAVVLTREVVRQAVVLGIYGLLLVVLFLVLQAPDVALSALVVSTVAYPLVLLAAIARVRGREKQERG
jgi:energy-converting hydrogenase B subunit D